MLNELVYVSKNCSKKNVFLCLMSLYYMHYFCSLLSILCGRRPPSFMPSARFVSFFHSQYDSSRHQYSTLHKKRGGGACFPHRLVGKVGGLRRWVAPRMASPQ